MCGDAIHLRGNARGAPPRRLRFLHAYVLYEQQVEKFKKCRLQTTLETHHGNRTHAARALGLQPPTCFASCGRSVSAFREDEGEDIDGE